MTTVKNTAWGKVCFIEEEAYRFAVYTYNDDPSSIYLSNLYVSENERGKGLGNQILKMTEKIGREMGREEIYLQVKIGSFAHKWYSRHGYIDFEPMKNGNMWMKKDISTKENITESISNKEALYSEYMEYIKYIGKHGTLQPKRFIINDDFWYEIGTSYFFLGYTSEGEFDEEAFNIFLNKFFDKYGEDVLNNDITIDEIYTTFLPQDMEMGLTPLGFSKYKLELIKLGKETFNSFEGYLEFNEEGQIYCERAVQLGEGMTAEDFMKEYGDSIGIYWSWANGGARTYYSNVNGPVVIFKGWVNPCDVNWGETIQTQSTGEDEIRLKNGATVQVDEIVDEYTGNYLLLDGSILLEA